VLDALDEAIQIAESCDIHVEIVHFKCSGIDNWGKAARGLQMIGEAKARGLDVDCDAYPYTAGSNPLKNLMPQWVQAGGVSAMLDRLHLPETRARIRDDIAQDGLNNWGRIPDWDCVRISIAPNVPHYAGRTVADLARERSADPIDVVCDCLIEDKTATRVLVTSISEDDVRDILRSPLTLVGSDGNCVADYGVTSQGHPHPRFYGTFPRILGHYVGELALIPLELAIHKMTGAPARALKLADRGLLKAGYRADVTVFDPADFSDQATYENPHQYPSGNRTTVLVNGVPVVEDATHTGALPGRVLKRKVSGEVL
jgi:N-acyl-D-aspartate/D-glutamate deacylase